MSFPRQRADVPWTGAALGAEFQLFDRYISQAIDGEDGGAYAPSNPIEIGGAGLRCTAGLIVDAGVVISTGGLLVQAGGVEVTGNSLFHDEVTFDDEVTFSEPVEFQETVEFFGAVQFYGAVDIAGLLTGDFGARFPAGGLASVEIGCPLYTTGTTALQGATTLTAELILSGAGRIRKRIVYAVNANQDFAVTDGDKLVFQAGIVTGTKTIRLMDAASVGAEIELVNVTSFAQTLTNESGGTINTITSSELPALAGLQPSSMRLSWMANGSYTGWTRLGA